MAFRRKRSRGWIVEPALTAWIDQEEKSNRLTQKALADVDGALPTQALRVDGRNHLEEPDFDSARDGFSARFSYPCSFAGRASTARIIGGRKKLTQTRAPGTCKGISHV